MDYGFSLTEIVFKEESGRIVLDKLKTRAPHSFDIEQDEYGNIINIIQYVTDQELNIDPTKFIHYAYQEEFGNPYGKSDLNMGVYRAYWSKSNTIKFLNIYLERHGMPLGIGKYPTGGDASLGDFKKIGKNLQAKTFVTMPENYSIEFLEATQSTDAYDKAIDKYNLMIARSLLVPDLMGFSGSETSGGAYALGQQQAEIFFNVIDYIRRQIERLITDKIVKPLVLYNFGDKEAIFKFTVVDDNRKDEQLKLWLEAVKTGKIPTTNDSINWFLMNIEAPEISEEELNRIEEEKKEQAAAIQGVGDPEEKKKEEKKEEGKEEKKEEKKEDKKEFTTNLSREKTIYEKEINFTEIENEIDAIEDKSIDELADLFELSINATIDEIRRKKIIERKKFDLIENLNLKHKIRIESKIKQMLTVSYKKGNNSARQFADEILLDDEDIASWIDQQSSFIIDKEEANIIGKVRAALSEGIRAGDSVRDIITTITTILGDYGIAHPQRIELFVRTNVLAAYNEGRAQQFSKLDNIQAYQYSAIMDGRTSAVCTALDKKIFQKSELSYYNPPNHFNCRSIIIPIFADEEIEENPPPPTVRDNSSGGSFLTLPKEES
jgi:SPP1 gp7 family putative phage head morphogenesis protein